MFHVERKESFNTSCQIDMMELYWVKSPFALFMMLTHGYAASCSRHAPSIRNPLICYANCYFLRDADAHSASRRIRKTSTGCFTMFGRGARHPVDVGFALTEAERRPQVPNPICASTIGFVTCDPSIIILDFLKVFPAFEGIFFQWIFSFLPLLIYEKCQYQEFLHQKYWHQSRIRSGLP